MTDTKRGRPALPEEQKRQQIGVRTSLDMKRALEIAAERNGRSVAQEAEWRLQQSIDDEKRAGGEHTASLLRIVAAEIEKIEGMTRKHWNKDLATWAAVARMFQTGPIQQLRPDRTSDDEIVMEAWRRLTEAREQKRQVCDILVGLGVLASPELPEARRPRKLGLFGTSAATGTAGSGGALDLAALAARYLGQPSADGKSREAERVRVRALDADEQTTKDLMAMVDELERLDELHRIAEADWTEATEPYRQEEERGRQLFREMMQNRAQELFRQGDYSLMGEAF
jgi:hypothetical protein